MPKLVSLHRYPIKSMGGESLDSCLLKMTGIEYDRQWMLINDQNQMITQRELPQMSKYTAKVIEGVLKLFDKDIELFSLSPAQDLRTEIKTHVWKSKVKAKLVSPVANEFFSDLLGTKLQLVIRKASVNGSIQSKYRPHM